MQLLSSRTKIKVLLALMLALPVMAATVMPSSSANNAKKTGHPKSKAPINTVSPEETKNLAAEQAAGLKIHMEERMTNFWRLYTKGPSKYCEVKFDIFNNGRFTDPTIWHASGDRGFDSAAMTTVDRASPFGMFTAMDHITCIAHFRAEPTGGSVSVSMPMYQGADSSAVDRYVAAKRKQQLNDIEIMKNRLVQAEKVVGPDSPKLSESINFLANLYKQVQNWTSAEASYKWAISIRQKNNGVNSKELAESLSDLGDMYVEKGDKVSAEETFKRVINTPDMPPCQGLFTAMQRYAKLCLKSNREKDSTLLYKRLENLQAGRPMDPLPANMTVDVAAVYGDKKDDQTAATTDSTKATDIPKAPGSPETNTSAKETDTKSETTKPAPDKK